MTTPLLIIRQQNYKTLRVGILSKLKQAQESLAAAMSLNNIRGIVTSRADSYKNHSTPKSKR